MTEEIAIRDITLPYINKITNFIHADDEKTIELVQLQFGTGITFVVKSSFWRNGAKVEKLGNYSWQDLLDKQVPWSGALLSIFHDLKMELSTYDVFKEGTTPIIVIDCSRDLAIIITDSTGLQVIQCSLTGYNKEGAVITIPNRKSGKITGENIETTTIKTNSVTDFTSVEYLEVINRRLLTKLDNIALFFNIASKCNLKGSDIALIQHITSLLCQDENQTNTTEQLDYNFLYNLAKKIENNTCT